MGRKPNKELRRGWTTGACATAATKAALMAFWGGSFPNSVTLLLPRGETPEFPLAQQVLGEDFAEVGILKDAGDDPDVTHGVTVVVKVSNSSKGIVFLAGEGVGMVTKKGLPVPVGEPAINPVPRQMMADVVAEMAVKFGRKPDVSLQISIPQGAEIAKKTWNSRLGIVGGLSILGTTGVVRPFSCSAWIASIHRGIDVARAAGQVQVAGCTGATSEAAVQALFDLPDYAMLDMGDFAGGMLKYLRKNPVTHVVIGGGIGKLTKMAQGAGDLHSARSQVDFALLNAWAKEAGLPDISKANTALEALEIAGKGLAMIVAERARIEVNKRLVDRVEKVSIIMVNRGGEIVARAED